MPLLPFSDASPPTTDASLLTSGTLADLRLSSNIPKLDAAATQQFQNEVDFGQSLGWRIGILGGSSSGFISGFNNDDTSPNYGTNWIISQNGNASFSGTLSVGGKIPAYLSVANSFTAGQTITAAANTSALTASYSVTGANTTQLLNLTGTWNTTGQVTAIKLNITDTASNSGSYLLDIGTGGGSYASKFSINKSGVLINASSAQFGGNISVPNGSAISLGGGLDCNLYRDGAANILAQRNGTNAQTTRIYGTYTDASNGRRLDITSTTGGIFTLTATGNGTGATGNLLKLTQPILLPASSVTLATNGDLAFEATSNTSLTIKYRGSDGTVRSQAIALDGNTSASIITYTLPANYVVNTTNSFVDSTLSVSLGVGVWLIQYSAHVISAAPLVGGSKSKFRFSGTAVESSGTHQYSGSTSNVNVESVAITLGTAVRQGLALDQTSLYSNSGTSHRLSGTAILSVSAAGSLTFQVCNFDNATYVSLQTPSFISATRIS